MNSSRGSIPARTLVLVTGLAVLTAAGGHARLAADEARSGEPAVYRPELAVPETLQPFLQDIEPGNDAFVLERDAAALEARLGELATRLREHPDRARTLGGWLLARDFRGAGLTDQMPPRPAARPLDVRRAEKLPADLSLDATSFGAELRRLLGDLRDVAVAEFLVTAIEPVGDASPASASPESATAPRTVRTSVRYDIVGAGTKDWRLQHVGVWNMTWRQDPPGWRILEWTPASHVMSRAAGPVFTEVTEEALGSNASFTKQLSTGLDDWMATFDSMLTRDSNGHHGVSVGDADGDGLEDLYIAQPAGLPNRLFRARGDSTFEDVTERSGLGVLDDTPQSLFADVDNDGDQDVVMATSTSPLLFVNDGSGRFSPVEDAFQFSQPLQGVLTSIAMADYDRDGFLDLYLCVYSYFFGAGEDKAGTPAPYYDARNGPPGVLFRNDGTGRFVDVTSDAGLDEGNDRYHFAAAWADFDEDGWQDLLVANDFGTKNLYRNLGARGGRVAFEDIAAKAGVLDHGAGMSAAWFDYDNDGLLDIYTGNMWSASGLRVTSSPAFMPEAPAAVRALYRRHARGNSLFRNLGDGRFEERTLEAHAEMGRWAWSSDALDFDSDGWEDLYITNGMLTREHGPRDLDGFFWRQVVARSPLTRAKGTPYDDAWRAINQLLIHSSIASRQRNVFLRNDGRGGFDEISGAVGLDLDQDGRSFATLDLDRDGDPDLAVMAARQAPQLRVFRNDFAASPEHTNHRGSSLAIRLVGTTSNRDAVGARVTVETDRFRRTKVVHAGSGFISQGSRELLFGLGDSTRIVNVTIRWPSGQAQTVPDVAPNTRIRIVEGGELRTEAFAPQTGLKPAAPETRDRVPSGGSGPPDATWMYEPFPAADFSLPDVGGETRSLAALRGRPAVLLFWSTGVKASRAAVESLAADGEALRKGGVAAIAVAVDTSPDPAGLAALHSTALPIVVATPELAVSYAILNRHLFMNRQDLRLPTTFLLDADGNIVKAYRVNVDASVLVRDAGAIQASPADRLARAIPFQGTFHSPMSRRNYLPYGRELLDQGLDAAAVVAFERAAQASPSASTLYRLGTLLTKTGEAARARAAYERALALQPDLAEASNDLGALLAQDGDLQSAIRYFRAALAATPEYPDALNNLGYALLLSGQEAEARGLYEKALELQPDFPEALNNLGLLYGRSGNLNQAERYFREALSRRAEYGEAANNVALVLVARGQTDEAVRLLEGLIEKSPGFEPAYVTLAKIHLGLGRTREGTAVLERLLQRNATHPVALELLRQSAAP